MLLDFSIFAFEYFPESVFKIYIKSNSSKFVGEKLLLRVFDPYSNFFYWRDYIDLQPFSAIWIAPVLKFLVSNHVGVEIYVGDKIVFSDSIRLSEKADLSFLNTFDFLKLYSANSLSIIYFYEIFIRKVYEKNNIKIKEGDIVVDIGSNIGMFAHYALKNKAKSIICCEPNPKAFAVLESVFCNNSKVCLNNFAISRNETSLQLLYPEEYEFSGGEFISSNSAVTWYNRDFRSVGVKGICFSDFLNLNNITKIDFLKIDCEGGEFEILTPENGVLFKNNVKNLVLECHGETDKIVDFLNAHSFIFEMEKNGPVLSLFWARNSNLEI